MNLSPEQWFLIVGAAVGSILAIFTAFTKLVTWFSDYVTRVAEQKIEEKNQELAIERQLSETELLERKNDAEAERKQKLALAETIERVLALYTQSQDIHAKNDARNVDAQERSIEVQAKLLTAIDTQTLALTTSQSWQEKRTEDTLAGIDLLGERTAGLVATANDTHAKVDTITGGLEQVKTKLDNLLSEVTKLNPNTEAIQSLEREITNLITLVKPLKDAIFRDAKTVLPPPVNLDETLELPEELEAATKELPPLEETEAPDNKPTPVNNTSN